MRGLMMDLPLLVSGFIEYAAENHGETEVVAREPPRAISSATPTRRRMPA